MDDRWLERLAADVAAQRFCSGWDVEWNPGEPDGGETTFTCSCGAMDGTYPSASAGEELLDAHVDDQERAHVRFVRRWMAEHEPGVPIHLSSYLGTDPDLE